MKVSALEGRAPDNKPSPAREGAGRGQIRYNAPMTLFNDPSYLKDFSLLLLMLGGIGLLSLFFFPAERRLARGALAALFIGLAIAGVALPWRAEALRAADRDLDPAQLAVLSRAIGRFPGTTFEVFTSRADPEAHALALKIVEAVKAGSGTAPAFEEGWVAPQKGVVLVVGARDPERGDVYVDTIGRPLMAARVAVLGEVRPDFADHTVRILVGGKP